MTVTTTEAAVDTSAVVKKKDPAVSPEGVDAELVGRLVEQARRQSPRAPTGSSAGHQTALDQPVLISLP